MVWNLFIWHINCSCIINRIIRMVSVMVIHKIKKNNEEEINTIDKSSPITKADQVSPSISNKNNEIKDTSQQVKTAQYYKKIDPTFLTMLNAQTSKRFVALFRNALAVKLSRFK